MSDESGGWSPVIPAFAGIQSLPMAWGLAFVRIAGGLAHHAADDWRPALSSAIRHVGRSALSTRYSSLITHYSSLSPRPRSDTVVDPERLDPRRTALIAYDVVRRALTPDDPARRAAMRPVLDAWVQLI